MAFLLRMRRRKKGEQAVVDPEILASLVSERTQLVDWAEVSRSMKGEDGYWWRSMADLDLQKVRGLWSEQALTWRFSFQHIYIEFIYNECSVFVQEDRRNLSFYFRWFSTRTTSRSWVYSVIGYLILMLFLDVFSCFMSIEQMFNWWLGLVGWIPGIPLWKVRGTPKIPNHQSKPLVELYLYDPIKPICKNSTYMLHVTTFYITLLWSRDHRHFLVFCWGLAPKIGWSKALWLSERVSWACTATGTAGNVWLGGCFFGNWRSLGKGTRKQLGCRFFGESG